MKIGETANPVIPRGIGLIALIDEEGINFAQVATAEGVPKFTEGPYDYVSAICGCVVANEVETSALEESLASASDCATASDARTVRPAIASNKSISPRIFMSRSPCFTRKRVRPYSFSNLSKKER